MMIQQAERRCDKEVEGGGNDDPLKLAFKRYRAISFRQFRDCAAEFAANDRLVETVQVARPAGSKFAAFLKEFIDVRRYPAGFYHLPNPFLPPERPGDVDLPTRLAADAIRSWPGAGPSADADAADWSRHRTNLDIEPDRPARLFDDAIKFADEPDDRLFASSWLYKLRWTTLGAQYNWTERRYVLPPESAACWEPPSLPDSLAELAAELCNITGAWSGHQYAAQAGIVNYYHPGHSMCFHLDTAEPYLAAPLVSLSAGLPAAYLLAGPSRSGPASADPAPVLLRHGDVVVMTGPSRRFYHAVARVFPCGAEASSKSAVGIADGCCFCPDGLGGGDGCADSACCRITRRYLRLTRVNINVRQLLQPGQDWGRLRDWTAAAADAGDGAE